jgi:hypothetical protein
MDGKGSGGGPAGGRGSGGGAWGAEESVLTTPFLFLSGGGGRRADGSGRCPSRGGRRPDGREGERHRAAHVDAAQLGGAERSATRTTKVRRIGRR